MTADPTPEALAATLAAWRHALAHRDPGGRLALYRRALGARIAAGDGNLDAAGALRLADSLVVARLARGHLPPAGWWPATLKRRNGAGAWATLLEAGWDEPRLVWPILAGTGWPDLAPGEPPLAEDLLVLDRRDRAAWGLVAGAAEALCGGPAWALDAALAGERPLRLHRHPWHWLAETLRQQEALLAPEPASDAAESAADAEAGRVVHLCLLEPRGFTAERVLAEATALRVDDLEHAELVKRWQRTLLPAPTRPEILVPAAPAARAEGVAA